jgi:hypothetical protein
MSWICTSAPAGGATTGQDQLHVDARHQDVAGIDEQQIAGMKFRDDVPAGIGKRRGVSQCRTQRFQVRARLRSIAISLLSSPPSAMARAANVECPLPISTTRAGRCWRICA